MSSAATSTSSPAKFTANFNAGPGVLPASVLRESARDLENYAGTGMSLMCMSHRSAEFEAVMSEAEAACRRLLSVPSTHAIIFLSGGGTGAFASIPLNLAQKDDTVSYVVTGSWSSAAATEAQKYAKVEVLRDVKKDTAAAGAPGAYSHIPPVSSWKQPSASSKYIHLCYNETVHGVAFTPEIISTLPANIPIVADMSSCFMAVPITEQEWARYACIYAGAQKNVGPSGVTVYIVRKDLLSSPQPICPSILNFTTNFAAKSMLNTPCTWSIYIMNLVFRWIEKEEGGVAVMEKNAMRRSQLIYQEIDESQGFYRGFITEKGVRSKQNICFTIMKSEATSSAASSPQLSEQDEPLIASFIREGTAAGFVGIAGHRSVGAIRVSIYNAQTDDACHALVKFMKEFRDKHQKKATKE